MMSIFQFHSLEPYGTVDAIIRFGTLWYLGFNFNVLVPSGIYNARTFLNR